ncbi:transmembrane protein 70 [Aphanomyces cochlioides]|nr:transmembrane protein 70 [Aphanomyces cochlioides]
MLRRIVRVKLPTAHAPKATWKAMTGRFYATEASEESAPEKELIYEAPLAKPVRMMKAVSITSCTLTSIGMPITCVYGATTSSVVAQWAMCGTVMIFGMGTTAAFHVLFKPYVLRMWIDRASEKITVETLNLLAAKTTTEFNLSDATFPDKSMHPMINFKAAGKHYFVHPEAFDESDRNLVERLLGRPLEELVPKQDEANESE